MPIGTSTKPALLMLPAREKTFVPFEASVPISENHFAPQLIMTGTLAQVSTLLMFVGFSQSPD
jgi:hypothetical protein